MTDPDPRLTEPGRRSSEAAAFVRAHTAPARAPLVPEFTLHLATEITPIWQATEIFLREANIEPPFWAFAWPGGQALARHILDHPDAVRGLRVLDFAAGCGVAALAAARAGAATVEACELDPLAAASIRLNAAVNGCEVTTICADLVGAPGRWDLILCGDVCYEAPMTNHIMPWFRDMRRAGAAVWIADPGRAYLPAGELTRFGPVYDVATTLELEDRACRSTVLYALAA